ncbi:hypothetical protein GIY23_16565 [Allosaccharopolyspora coralli]|uniref:Uncharacterized protein n=1 Tax=Allosaccharopolyspora coralli TaxID=2665642 RepID=A0A5Q3QCE8_9PSEU|nr:hypothetical protein [Allosaccharopolyspora coralli]QGK70914.1 hypothetical protein GIY23_16565 [Allosaccharopolyspora coralli]
MARGRDEAAEWGEFVLDQMKGPVADRVRKKVASWRDPRARLLRRRRRAKHTTVAGGVGTGVLGGSSATAFMADDLAGLQAPMDVMANLAGVGFGALALPAGIGTIVAWRKYRALLRTPLPEAPPEPVALPPADSAAREPMRKLRDAENSLHESLVQLTAASVDGVNDRAEDARATAVRTAGALRRVSDRLRSVESAQRFAPEADQETLRADATRLRADLDEGVEGYGKLVAAAARAVAASDEPEQASLMQDATDRLAGFAEGLHEISGRDPQSEAIDQRRDRRPGT